MVPKSDLARYYLALIISSAGLLAVAAISVSTLSIAQTPLPPATTSIERGSKAERVLKMKEPSFETREARLKAKPLNWNSTVGKPNSKRSAAKAGAPTEKEHSRTVSPETSEGGKPDPNAEKEARRLHPHDWN